MHKAMAHVKAVHGGNMLPCLTLTLATVALTDPFRSQAPGPRSMEQRKATAPRSASSASFTRTGPAHPAPRSHAAHPSDPGAHGGSPLPPHPASLNLMPHTTATHTPNPLPAADRTEAAQELPALRPRLLVGLRQAQGRATCTRGPTPRPACQSSAAQGAARQRTGPSATSPSALTCGPSRAASACRLAAPRCTCRQSCRRRSLVGQRFRLGWSWTGCTSQRGCGL